MPRPWNKGIQRTTEVKEKLRLANLGKRHSEKTRRKMSLSRMGKSIKKRSGLWRHTDEWKKAQSERMKGHSFSEETLEKMKASARRRVAEGRHFRWKGGITPMRKKIMASVEYRSWRKSVLEKDGLKCIECGSSSRLQADHIKPFALYPELRTDVQNGRTLCFECHKKTATYGNKVFAFP